MVFFFRVQRDNFAYLVGDLSLLLSKAGLLIAKIAEVSLLFHSRLQPLDHHSVPSRPRAISSSQPCRRGQRSVDRGEQQSGFQRIVERTDAGAMANRGEDGSLGKGLGL